MKSEKKKTKTKNKQAKHKHYKIKKKCVLIPKLYNVQYSTAIGVCLRVLFSRATTHAQRQTDKQTNIGRWCFMRFEQANRTNEHDNDNDDEKKVNIQFFSV